MNQAMLAIIKKDFRSITANRRLFVSLLVVPLCLIIVMPSIFMLTAHMAPNDSDLQAMLELVPQSSWSGSAEQTLMDLVFNYILPVFFLIIPIMASSIMAASSFVGEKEKHTLETLLYAPLTLNQIFRSKVMASFLLSMLVSLLSFVSMILVVETEAFFLMGALLIPKLNWLIILLLLSPGVSMIAVTLIVRVSAKAQSMEESQQSAVFLILPLVLLIAGQFSGVMLLSPLLLLALSLVCGVIAWLLLKKSMKRFSYELLL
ncbi:MAG TPA: ABC transporter permease subunit [Candidatus Blautia pullicola]|uniref:ABC transporter permease subunit n=1 Tax=Candidatus Blautia pullicola TaxID=2838498 RepID=A0A9D2JTG4_9FIRM|nr:ABC transporter permease subunit [Candidatus Blautia pullicola]